MDLKDPRITNIMMRNMDAETQQSFTEYVEQVKEGWHPEPTSEDLLRMLKGEEYDSD